MRSESDWKTRKPWAGGPPPSARPSCPAPAPCPAPPVQRVAGGRQGSRRWGQSSAGACRVWGRPGPRSRSEPSRSAPAGTASPTWSWSGSSQEPGEPSEGRRKTVGNESGCCSTSVEIEKQRKESKQDENRKEAAREQARRLKEAPG